MRLLTTAATALVLIISVTSSAEARKDSNGNDVRPAKWCGWYLRQVLGVKDKSLNLARNWVRYGAKAGGPCVGCVVVWRHHVGIITGKTEQGWLVKSGNDGKRVRERPRSIAGAIAFRTASVGAMKWTD